MNSASGNVWRQLKTLIVDDVTTVGTVSGQNGDGTVNVDLVGGGTVVATGSATNGTDVFISNGFIRGVAPSLTEVVLDV